MHQRNLQEFALKYKSQSAHDMAFTELLEWVGWVCGETEEFPGLLWLNLPWPLESRWIVYGPENGYNFPYSHLLRVKMLVDRFMLGCIYT